MAPGAFVLISTKKMPIVIKSFVLSLFFVHVKTTWILSYQLNAHFCPSVWVFTIWANMPFFCISSVGLPDSFTTPSDRTTILSAPETVLILWAITMTVLSLISRERAVCIAVSFSTSRLADASSSRIMGASLRNALAIDIRWRSPPESSLPFSPIL